MSETSIRLCYRQQVNALAWRRAQKALNKEFEKQKQALTAALSEHIESGHDPEAFFTELEPSDTVFDSPTKQNIASVRPQRFDLSAAISNE